MSTSPSESAGSESEVSSYWIGRRGAGAVIVNGIVKGVFVKVGRLKTFVNIASAARICSYPGDGPALAFRGL